MIVTWRPKQNLGFLFSFWKNHVCHCHSLLTTIDFLCLEKMVFHLKFMLI